MGDLEGFQQRKQARVHVTEDAAGDPHLLQLGERFTRVRDQFPGGSIPVGIEELVEDGIKILEGGESVEAAASED